MGHRALVYSRLGLVLVLNVFALVEQNEHGS